MKLNGAEKFKFTSKQEKRMAEGNDLVIGSKEETAQSHPVQVNIKMQQGEHTGQPLYSNFTSVQGGSGVVIVDFGFLDPQIMNALSRMVRSGKKTPDAINAKMSCRMAISIEAANQLAQQLDQLLGTKVDSQVRVNQQDAAAQMMQTASSSNLSEGKDTSESRQSGFRFPWSKKTH